MSGVAGSYSLEQINLLRKLLEEGGKGKRYLPHRTGSEHCQVLAVVNFKGRSGKTTGRAHLAQYLALRGYRVLAVNHPLQASLTALHGYQPAFDIGPNETLFGAIRYDEQRQSLEKIVRKTYFTGLDFWYHQILNSWSSNTTRRRPSLTERVRRFSAAWLQASGSVEGRYDVMVLDCPPQLGFLTLGALCAATSVLITVHPQMLDVMSMCQFLLMASDLLSVVQDCRSEYRL